MGDDQATGVISADIRHSGVARQGDVGRNREPGVGRHLTLSSFSLCLRPSSSLSISLLFLSSSSSLSLSVFVSRVESSTATRTVSFFVCHANLACCAPDEAALNRFVVAVVRFCRLTSGAKITEVLVGRNQVKRIC